MAERPRTVSKSSGSAGNPAFRDASPDPGRPGRRCITALRLASRLLARRGHTEWELAARLRRRGVSDSDIADTLDLLKRQGYLDDAATAALWARSWRTHKGWGPIRVRAELIRRGVDRQVTDPLLAELFSDDETEAAALRVAARLVRRPAYARAGPRQAPWLAAHLARRGFPADLALRVAGRCCPGRDNDMIEPDE
ncbi:MAG TPA: regulatory protein RecX [Nitrospiria bacterium]|nr:regulatory protein RecX [Nitrospiria bacterium]